MYPRLDSWESCVLFFFSSHLLLPIPQRPPPPPPSPLPSPAAETFAWLPPGCSRAGGRRGHGQGTAVTGCSPLLHLCSLLPLLLCFSLSSWKMLEASLEREQGRALTKTLWFCFWVLFFFFFLQKYRKSFPIKKCQRTCLNISMVCSKVIPVWWIMSETRDFFHSAGEKKKKGFFPNRWE